jgi:hypothetical protein
MAFANLFSRANLPDFGGRSYADLNWTTPIDAGGRPEDAARQKIVAVIAEAEEALRGRNDPREALRLLGALEVGAYPLVRRLKLAAARELEDPKEIIAVIGRPRTIEELVLCVDAYLQTSNYELARTVLTSHSESLNLPQVTRAELEERIELMERMPS